MRLFNFMQDHHVVHVAKAAVIASYADALAGTKTLPVVLVKMWNEVYWELIKGAGATGTTLITCEASDDASGTHVDPIPFWWRKLTASDTWSAWALATDAGITTTAGADQAYQFAVLAEDVYNKSDKAYEYVGVRLKAVEQVDSPQEASFSCWLHGAKATKEIPATVLS